MGGQRRRPKGEVKRGSPKRENKGEAKVEANGEDKWEAKGEGQRGGQKGIKGVKGTPMGRTKGMAKGAKPSHGGARKIQ